MAAVYRIPLVKFLGISPTGLNASSEGELRVYYDLIKSTQEFLLRAPLQIVLDLLQIELFGDVDDAITFDFFPLYELTEAEEAQMRASDADTDVKLIQQGVISAEESRKRIADDPNTPYVDLDPMKLPPPPQQPGEGERSTARATSRQAHGQRPSPGCGKRTIQPRGATRSRRWPSRPAASAG